MVNEELRAQLEKLQVEFRARLAERVSALARTIACWQVERSESVLREAHESAHKLAGSGSTFGAPAVTASARKLEQLLGQAMAPGSPLGLESEDQIAAAMRALESAALACADAGSMDAKPARATPDQNTMPPARV